MYGGPCRLSPLWCGIPCYHVVGQVRAARWPRIGDTSHRVISDVTYDCRSGACERNDAASEVVSHNLPVVGAAQHSNGGALAAGPDVVSGYENTRRIPQLNGRARNSGIHVLNDVAADHDVVVRPPIIDRRSLAILDDVACD